MRKLTIFLFFLFSLSSFSYGQRDQKVVRLGIGFQGSTYTGDLTYNATPFYRFYPGLNASILFGKLKVINPFLNIGFSKIVSQNREFPLYEGYSVNKFVQNTFFYADFRIKVIAFKKRKVNPYIALGAGFLTHSPQDEDGNPLIDNFESRLEGEEYSSITPAFPLSGGVDIKMNPILGLGLDYTFRYTLTDYLDNISDFGQMKGKDMLHTFMVNVFLTFDPEYPVLKRFLRPKDQKSRL